MAGCLVPAWRGYGGSGPRAPLRLPPPGPQGRAPRARGGPVCVILGPGAVPPGVARDAIGAYLHRINRAGRVLRGATALFTA